MDDSQARRTPESRMGSLYPIHSIIAHIDDRDHAAAAETALRAAGWEGDDVVVASGEEVTRVSTDAGDGRSLLQRIGRAFPSEESQIENEFKEAASRGAWAVMVRAETDARRDEATSILKSHRASGLRHYGDRVITDL